MLADHLREKLNPESLSDYRRYRARIVMRPVDFSKPIEYTYAPRARVLEKCGIRTLGDLIAYFEERESKLDDFNGEDFDRLVSVLYDELPREPPRRPC